MNRCLKCCVFCVLVLSACSEQGVNLDPIPTEQPGEYFDDFSYSDSSDPQIRSFGWHIVDGSSGPPGGARYARENITFHQDSLHAENTIMHVTAEATDSFDDMRLARIETSGFTFWEGTYAARVYFDNTPADWEDGNVQAFYTINELKSESDPDYAECDFEYLAWDIWGGGNTNAKLYTVTWETYANNPWNPNRAFTTVEDVMEGWHTLIITAVDSSTVRYYVDDLLIAEHSTSTLGDSVYPDAPMNISFSNWISTDQAGSGLGSRQGARSYTMKVDWVYHAQNEGLTYAEIVERVADFRQRDLARLNDMVPLRAYPNTCCEARA